MEHEDKSSAPTSPPVEVVGGRTRVVSAAAAPGLGEGGGHDSEGAVVGGAKDATEVGAEPEAGDAAANPPRNRKRPEKGPGSPPNNVRRLRIERMMSKAELARRANVSVLTMDRVEKGYGCRMDTKRKILEALGLTLADRVRVFGDDE